MSYSNKWLLERKVTREKKINNLTLIKKQFKSNKDYTKISDLIDLYMESHDLVTKVGLEISKLIDKKNKNS